MSPSYGEPNAHDTTVSTGTEDADARAQLAALQDELDTLADRMAVTGEDHTT
jgi:hypothetical protein